MKKSLILGSMLMATCLSVVDVEASYTDAIREAFANKNVYAEYEINVIRQGTKKYTYGRIANNMYFKCDLFGASTETVNIENPIDNRYVGTSSEVKKDAEKINKVAKALNSLQGMPQKGYDLNVIKDNKIYFVNTGLQKGKWANLGDFEQSQALYMQALRDTPDGIYYMNVMRDVVTSSKERMSVKVVNASKVNLYGKIYDCEEVIVQRLSDFGRPIGDQMICKLYFDNGCISYFTPLKYAIGDSPYAKHKNYSIEYAYGDEVFKVLTLTNDVQNESFDMVETCKFERFPLGW